MSHGGDGYGRGVFKEDDAIVANSKPAAGLAFELFHVAGAGRRVGLELGHNPAADACRELNPLAARSGRKDNGLPQLSHIAIIESSPIPRNAITRVQPRHHFGPSPGTVPAGRV